MRFLISALGSAGDVHPFIAIARVLIARGHGVRMIASPHFEARIRRAGIDFVALGTADDYERLLERPELWHPRRGAHLVIDELLKRLPQAYEVTRAATTPDTVLVGSSLSWAMRLVQERTGQPGATVHLSPTLLLSAMQPAVMPGIGDVSWMPTWAVRLLHRAADRLVLDRLTGPRMDRFRARLGLPPVRRIWSRWMHSPDLVVCAWPAWFAPPQPDWPANAVTTGFPIFDEPGAQLDDALEAFLVAGPPPIGITPGSAMAHGERFFARALAAVAGSGRRAVLVTPFRDQLPTRLPDGTHHVAYAPFSALLPRLSMLIHHGGIGTSAQALAAGLPQIVVPFAHDQFDNAARLQRLGVARTLRVASPVSDWVDTVRRQASAPAASIRERMTRDGSGAVDAAERLESLARRTEQARASDHFSTSLRRGAIRM